jgi:hypothetical protein
MSYGRLAALSTEMKSAVGGRPDALHQRLLHHSHLVCDRLFDASTVADIRT